MVAKSREIIPLPTVRYEVHGVAQTLQSVAKRTEEPLRILDDQDFHWWRRHTGRSVRAVDSGLEQ
jgi:hypothetical protein